MIQKKNWGRNGKSYGCVSVSRWHSTWNLTDWKEPAYKGVKGGGARRSSKCKGPEADSCVQESERNQLDLGSRSRVQENNGKEWVWRHHQEPAQGEPGEAAYGFSSQHHDGKPLENFSPGSNRTCFIFEKITLATGQRIDWKLKGRHQDTLALDWERNEWTLGLNTACRDGEGEFEIIGNFNWDF